MQTRKCLLWIGAAAALASGATAIGADAISVGEAWVRASAPGQSVAGAYMNITAPASAALVAASSPAAGRVELHTMSMDGGVMRMRALERLDLPANKTVSLKPGGHHLMLIDIKRPLKAGERVRLTLTVQDHKDVKSVVEVDAKVRPLAGAATGQEPHR